VWPVTARRPQRVFGRAARAILRSRVLHGVGDRAAFEVQRRAARVLLRSESGSRRADGSRTGSTLLEAAPSALGRLAARLAHGTILVSGTNGKTTTTAMITAILEDRGFAVVTSAVGANQPGGITAELLETSRSHGRMRADIGVFEVDELWLARVVEAVDPVVLVLLNLFRDQLDRQGEIELVAGRWHALLETCPETTTVVACADDPRLMALTADRARRISFGLDDDSVALDALADAADPPRCPRCARTYSYDAVNLAHLGRYRCETCGTERPPPDVMARDICLDGSRGSSFTIHARGSRVHAQLAVPGVFNVYNATAAWAACSAVTALPATSVAPLGCFHPVFGRGEEVPIEGTSLLLLLTKNPTGMNEVVRTVLQDPDVRPLNLFMLLNDGVHDGRDISWIWDADLETFAPHLRQVVCAGSRNADLAVRLKYAGVDGSRIQVASSPEHGLALALGASGARLYVLANYTAMLDLHDVLAARGAVASIWR
jgi:UDP-N-acetylmuramyl tripeptide synthase